jgi:hypothetical protein
MGGLCRLGVGRRESGGKASPRARLDRAARDRIAAGQGLCGRDRIRTCVGNAGDFTGRIGVSSRVLVYPRLVPLIARDVHRRPIDSFGRPFPSPPVPPPPVRPSVERRESGGKSLAPTRVGSTPVSRSTPGSAPPQRTCGRLRLTAAARSRPGAWEAVGGPGNCRIPCAGAAAGLADIGGHLLLLCLVDRLVRSLLRWWARRTRRMIAQVRVPPSGAAPDVQLDPRPPRPRWRTLLPVHPGGQLLGRAFPGRLVELRPGNLLASGSEL